MNRLKQKTTLSMSNFISEIKSIFENIPIELQNNKTISLTDCLLSGLALFSMKMPSMLQFDNQRDDVIVRANLKQLFKVKKVPSDTFLRERLDIIPYQMIRSTFKRVFAILQRSNVLERYHYLNNHYILSIDGTGVFSSHHIHCKNCCEKHHRDGRITYYHQILGASIVCPDNPIVIPFCPEPIMQQDGKNKNDCERNAIKRFLNDFRREHPHLKVIVVQDALSANGPNIKELIKKNVRYILVVKPGSNKALFEFLKGIEETMEEHSLKDEKGVEHQYKFINGIPLNDTHEDVTVNFLQYEEKSPTGKIRSWTWITDIVITKKNVFKIMKGGRARWKIENETFNTLKNQGYHFEHNFGHGYQNLSTILSFLMMLAFLLDQAQQLSCKLFQKALKKRNSKTALWHKMRNLFEEFLISSWQEFFYAIAYGKRARPLFDTS